MFITAAETYHIVVNADVSVNASEDKLKNIV